MTQIADLRTPDRVLRQLASFEALDPDWAGPGTVLPPPRVMAAARALVDGALAAGLRMPHASPSSDGEVGLSWFRGRDLFCLSVDVDDHAVWVLQVDKVVSPGDVIRTDDPAFVATVVRGLGEFYGDGATVTGGRDDG